MGIHYVNSTLVGDDKVNVAAPELIVYEPTRKGRLRMVAAEYVVFQKAWDAKHSSPPKLFGREFELVAEGNRYGLPPFYELTPVGGAANLPRHRALNRARAREPCDPADGADETRR